MPRLPKSLDFQAKIFNDQNPSTMFVTIPEFNTNHSVANEGAYAYTIGKSIKVVADEDLNVGLGTPTI
jgi:hypothetical protein